MTFFFYIIVKQRNIRRRWRKNYIIKIDERIRKLTKLSMSDISYTNVIVLISFKHRIDLSLLDQNKIHTNKGQEALRRFAYIAHHVKRKTRKKENDNDDDVYVCTSTLLHSIAIRQNRIIEKRRKRARAHTHIHTSKHIARNDDG
jgi:hypothetical protein